MSDIMEKFLAQAMEDADEELKQRAAQAKEELRQAEENRRNAEEHLRKVRAEIRDNRNHAIVSLIGHNVPGETIPEAFGISRKELLKLAKENNLTVTF